VLPSSFYRKFTLFAELDDRELASIAAVSKTRRLAKDDAVFHADESGDVFYLIREGQVKVTMTSPEGKEIILSILGVGDFFGELALLTRAPRNASIIARDACTLLALDIVDFHELFGRHPELARAIREEAARRMIPVPEPPVMPQTAEPEPAMTEHASD